ncbi:MAG: hypothetical protein WD226_12795 [Planctomycetota bacterium]
MKESPTVCSECQAVVENPPRFSALAEGGNCSACLERVMDALPPALPGFARDRPFVRVPAGRGGATLRELLPEDDGPGAA